MGILILPVLMLVMYFMLIRPQQLKAKEHQRLLATVDVGDDIVTTSGIYGRISDVDGNTLFLQVADGVEIKVTKESVAGIVSYDEPADDDDVADDDNDDLDDDDDA